MTREISNSDDIIDSRDVIKRIADLESELEDAHHEEFSDGDPLTAPDFDAWLQEIQSSWHLYTDEATELLKLRALAEEGESLPDWPHGTGLIRESHFQDYAQEVAEDIGAIDRNARWPLHCIDWERAADELKMDYTSLDFDGVIYWARS